MRQHDTAHWLAECERLEIPAAAVARLDDLMSDAHLQATDFFVSLNDAAMGELRFPRSSVRMDGVQAPISMPPRLGEHTQELLRQAGLSDAAIAALQTPKTKED